MNVLRILLSWFSTPVTEMDIQHQCIENTELNDAQFGTHHINRHSSCHSGHTHMRMRCNSYINVTKQTIQNTLPL